MMRKGVLIQCGLDNVRHSYSYKLYLYIASYVAKSYYILVLKYLLNICTHDILHMQLAI